MQTSFRADRQLAFAAFSVLFTASAFAQSCPNDDTLVGNQSCASAHVLAVSAGVLLDLAVFGDNYHDYFQFTVPAGETLTASATFQHAQGNIDLSLLDVVAGACSSVVAAATSLTNNETLTWTNTGAAPMTVVLQADLVGSDPCNDYELSWGTSSCATGDLYGFNHSCGTAYSLNSTIDILEADLVVSNAEADYFRIPMDSGSELFVRAEFTHAEGDVDIILYRDDQCDIGPPLAMSSGTGDVETFTVDSQFGTILKVYRTGGAGDCNAYRLTILQERAHTLGGTFCAGLSNSTGWGAPLSASGSTRVVDNDLRLAAGFLPHDSFGFYLNSRGAGYFMPPGSQGLLCIDSGGIGRFLRPGEVVNSGTSGFTAINVDLGSIPRPTGTVGILPGERWAFQYWYRDSVAGVPVSNFSNAIMVWFE